jgi:small subunit ribosomal protein S9
MKKKITKRDIVIATGTRKRAVARATLRPGKGVIRINKKPIENLQPEMIKLMILEPLRLAGDVVNKYDISVIVKGGGIVGQAEAARQSIALALVAKNKKLKETFLNYDRALLVADPRRTEPHKPSRSSKGPRKHKQRSKR